MKPLSKFLQFTIRIHHSIMIRTLSINTIVCISIVMLLWSCGHNTSHHGTTEKVELNDGSKWAANPETTAGIQKMSVLLNQFQPSDDVSDYEKLSEELNVVFKEIFAQCTMTGPAHDQLHNYLLPMLGIMKKMKSDDLQLCKESFTKMDDRLREYPVYFE